MTGHAMWRLAALARPLTGRFGAATALGALASGSAVALLAVSGYLISQAALAPPLLSLAPAITVVRLLSLTRATARYLERLVSHDAALRLLGGLRVRLFRRLEPLVPSGLPDARTGDLLSRFVADVDTVQHLYLRGLAPWAVAVVVAAGSVALTSLVLPSAVAWLVWGLVAAAVAVPTAAVALTRAAARRQAAARARLASEVAELLEAAAELVVSGRDTEQLHRVDAADRALGRIARRDAVCGGLADAAVEVLAGVTMLAVLAAGVAATASGELPGVLLAAVTLLTLGVFDVVRPLPEAARQLAATAGAAQRIIELTDRDPPVVDPARPLPPPAGEVLRVEDARIRYEPDGPWVLDGVDLELRPGRRVALIGPSGAGKSTLAALLVRFRDPDAGRVTLDGQDLAAYAQDDVRRVVTLVGQDAHLFATTLRENVRLARPEASDEEILAALERARVLDWVRTLPEGLDTPVGEHGVGVSGGQRQRIALARAFLSGARLLVLDEPAAHLDPKTAEELIGDVLDTGGDELGVLLITHTARGLDRADEIVVLDHGRVVDRGSFGDLLERDRHLAALHRRDASGPVAPCEVALTAPRPGHPAA